MNGKSAQQIIEDMVKELRQCTVNFCLVVQDDKETKWIYSNPEWAMGVFELIETKVRHDWDVSMFSDEEDEGEEWKK